MYGTNSDSLIIPSNKFFPPHVSKEQSLLREKLLMTKFPSGKTSDKAIILEAQAGQGKTTLVCQFLDYRNKDYIWYQIGAEDSDPVFLLSALLTNLSSSLDNFSSPRLERILTEGSVGPLDVARCADILLQDLEANLKSDLYFIFDDLHLIEFDALTNGLLAHLIDRSSPFVKFALISRQPLKITARTIRDGHQITYLSTEDLALTDLEIESLFHDILKRNISRNDAIKIQEITNGWIMGIILASHPISGRKNFWHGGQETTGGLGKKAGHMLEYFQDEIFAQLPKDLHEVFLKLAFLQEIPVELGAAIAKSDNFGEILADISQDNYFIYRLDDQDRTFRFHHFFQEFLREKARERFPEEEINAIYSQEADYYLKLEMVEKALTCFRNAGDFKTMETVLKERGMHLIARNRTISILTLLQTLPDNILEEYNWLMLYSALLRIDYVPQTTLPLWNKARAKFIETGEEVGELIALSQTIYYHFVISGEYNTGTELLPRTEKLLNKNIDQLPPGITIMAARNLASGFCFFDSNMEKARHYIQIATQLSERHSIRNFVASSRFIQGYIELLSGNRAKYLREAEACYTLFHDPLVGESNRLTMRVINLCFLSMTGDHSNFLHQQQALQDSIDQTIVDQTVAAPYLYVWGSSAYYSTGNPKKALALLEKGLGKTVTATSAHMHSQIIQWQAFGYSITGYSEKAKDLIEEACKLRENAGGPFYIAFNNIIAGAVYTRIGDFEKAEEHLTKGFSISESLPSTYLMICALFNRSYLRYLTGGADAALDDLEAALSMMKINGYDHFWTFEPTMVATLLGEAVTRDIEASFAKSLARKRLKINFTDQGVPLPLLRFILLDNFEINVGPKVLFRAKDLTPFQRELLGLLITSKGQRIPQERIQLELWPDSSPEKARKSFDTLLTRLRKLLSPELPLPVKEYLLLQKGILCLMNYSIDAMEFLEAARTGLSHGKNNDWWQAQNAFQLALSLYKGALPEDTFRSEQVLGFNDVLANVLVEMGNAWAENLATTGRYEEAISIIEIILGINYQEESLTHRLYKLYLASQNPLKAKSTIDRYQKSLINAEYSEEEARAFVDEIIRDATEGPRYK